MSINARCWVVSVLQVLSRNVTACVPRAVLLDLGVPIHLQGACLNRAVEAGRSARPQF